MEKIVNYIKERIWTAEDMARKYAYLGRERLPKRFVWSRIKKHLTSFKKGEGSKIILLPGLRGTGKTTLLSQVYLYLIEDLKISKNRVLFISMDEASKLLGSGIYEIIKAYEEILGERLVSLKKEVYFLIDEVHYDGKWSTALKVIHDTSAKAFILATGSSALSMKISTDLVRRATVEKVYPLNFSEYFLLKRKKSPPFRPVKQVLRAMLSERYARSKKKVFEKLYRELSTETQNLEVRRFLKCGSLPFSLYMEENEVCGKTLGILDKVVYEDVAKLENFEHGVLDKMFKILLLIAESPSVNFQTISNYVEISKHTVSRVINAFEKADVLFSLKPLGSEGKVVRKAWKYYFTAPVMRFALKKSVGLFKEKDMGLLFEDYLAGVFKRMRETSFPALEVFYDPYRNGADFVLVFMDRKIPVEIGFGKKESKGIKQVRASAERYGAGYGILISDSGFRIEDGVIFIPREFFLWL